MLLAIKEQDLIERSSSLAEAFANATATSISIHRVTTDRTVTLGVLMEKSTDYVRAQSDRGEEWVVMVALGDSFRLYVAFDECWTRFTTRKPSWQYRLIDAIQNAAGPNKVKPPPSDPMFAFGGLRIRFYLQRAEAGASAALKQWMRCEWEPYRSTLVDQTTTDADLIKEALMFDAKLAAHPHIHFDSVPLSGRVKKAIKWDQGDGSDSHGGFGEHGGRFMLGAMDGFVTSTSFDTFHMHLPSSSRWPEATFTKNLRTKIIDPLPHQRYPASADELTNWFSWSLHYVINQFEEYVSNS